MSVVLLAVLAGAGIAMLLFAQVVSRRPALAALLILLTVVQTELVDIATEIGGFRITPTDVIITIVSGALVLRLLEQKGFTPEQNVLFVLAALAVVSLAFGALTGPVGAAVNEFRPYLCVIVAALYFSTVEMSLVNRLSIARAWMWGGAILGGIVVVRWLAMLTGIRLGVFEAFGGVGFEDAVIRVIGGKQTLTIATAALVIMLPGFSNMVPAIQRYRLIGTILLVISILLNRRTLWLALALALLVLMFRNRKIGKKLATVGGVMILIATVGISLFGPDLEGGVGGSALAQTGTGTAQWRIQGWLELVDNLDDPADVIIGRPFGSGYSRIVGGQETVVQPHNFYVQTYLRTGILGLVALAGLLALIVVSLSRMQGEEGIPFAPTHMLVLVAILGAYILAWEMGPDQGIVIGLAMASAEAERRAIRNARRLPAGRV